MFDPQTLNQLEMIAAEKSGKISKAKSENNFHTKEIKKKPNKILNNDKIPDLSNLDDTTLKQLEKISLEKKSINTKSLLAKREPEMKLIHTETNSLTDTELNFEIDEETLALLDQISSIQSSKKSFGVIKKQNEKKQDHSFFDKNSRANSQKPATYDSLKQNLRLQSKNNKKQKSNLKELENCSNEAHNNDNSDCVIESLKGYEQIMNSKDGLFLIENIYNSLDGFSIIEPQNLEKICTDLNLPGNIEKKQKLIIVEISSQDFYAKEKFFGIFLQSWAYLEWNKGDAIHIFGKFSQFSNAIVFRDIKDHEKFHEMNYAVLWPSLLVGPSQIVKRKKCTRKFEISSLFASKKNFNNIFGLEGSFFHSVFESVLKLKVQQKIDEKQRLDIVENCIEKYVTQLYYLEADYNEFLNNALKFFDESLQWKIKYIDKKEYIIDSRKDDVKVKILEIVAIEKKYVSYKLGVESYVDLIVKCQHTKYSTKQSKVFSAPLELKTTKDTYNSIDHHNQLYYYTVIMNENDFKNTENVMSLIYYSKLNKNELVIFNDSMASNLILERNKVVRTKFKSQVNSQDNNHNFSKRINDDFQCKWCDYGSICSALDISKKTMLKQETPLKKVNIGFQNAEDNYIKEEKGGNFLNRTLSNLSITQDDDTKKIRPPKKFKEIVANPPTNFKLVDIEDLVTNQEPMFSTLQEVHSIMDIQKLQYCQKWLEILTAEDREIQRKMNSTEVKVLNFQKGFTKTYRYLEKTQNQDLNDQKTLEFDFENYKEVYATIKKKQTEFKNQELEDCDLNLKFKSKNCNLEKAIILYTNLYQKKVQICNTIIDSFLWGDLEKTILYNEKGIEESNIKYDTNFSVKIVLKCSMKHQIKVIKRMFKNNYEIDYISTNWIIDIKNYMQNYKKESFKIKLYKASIQNLLSTKEYLKISETIVNTTKPINLKEILNNDKQIDSQKNDNNPYQDFETVQKYLIPKHVKKLNVNQKNAIEQSINCLNYNVIYGCKSSGKIFTSCMLLKILLEMDKRVLVINSVIGSMKKLVFKFLKYFSGDVDKIVSIEPLEIETNDGSFDISLSKLKDYQEIESNFLQKNIVFSIANNNDALYFKKFDYTLILNASKVSEPAIIEKLLFSSKFILVGDCDLFKPNSISNEITSKGLEVSLLERLVSSFSKEISCLNTQYHLSKGIQKLLKDLVYKNREKVDLNNYTNKTKQLSKPDNEELEWAKDMIFLKNDLIFIDTNSFLNVKEDLQSFKPSFKQKSPCKSITISSKQYFEDYFNFGNYFNFKNLAISLAFFIIDKLQKYNIPQSKIVVMTASKKNYIVLKNKFQETKIEILQLKQKYFEYYNQNYKKWAFMVCLLDFETQDYESGKAENFSKDFYEKLSIVNEGLYMVGDQNKLQKLNEQNDLLTYIKLLNSILGKKILQKKIF